MPNDEDLIQRFAVALDEKHAQQIRAVRMTNVSSVADYFLFATAQTRRHADTLASVVMDVASEYGMKPLGTEGQETAQWILIDYGSILVHVFLPDAREHYGIEKLWLDAPEVELKLPQP